MKVMHDHGGKWRIVGLDDQPVVTIEPGRNGESRHVFSMLGFDVSYQNLETDHNGIILSNEDAVTDNDPHFLEDYDGDRYILLDAGGRKWKLYKLEKTEND